MTRDEALKTMRGRGEFGSPSSDGWLLNCLAALGLLKFDEPKSAYRKALEALQNLPPYSGLPPHTFLEAIDDAGLKIVDKD